MKSICLSIVLSAAALVCAASPAIAHEFTISPEGSGFNGKGGTQTIVLGSHSVSCKLANINGTAKKALLLMEVIYESCEAAILKTAVTIHSAVYADSANGVGGIGPNLTRMTILTKPTAESECVYTLPETSKLVNSVSYTTKATGITIASTLKELAYELKETGTTACGTNGEKGVNGEYKGEVTTETYENPKCDYLFGGAWLLPDCKAPAKFVGFFEEVMKYTTLKWA